MQNTGGHRPEKSSTHQGNHIFGRLEIVTKSADTAFAANRLAVQTQGIPGASPLLFTIDAAPMAADKGKQQHIQCLNHRAHVWKEHSDKSLVWHSHPSRRRRCPRLQRRASRISRWWSRGTCRWETGARELWQCSPLGEWACWSAAPQGTPQAPAAHTHIHTVRLPYSQRHVLGKVVLLGLAVTLTRKVLLCKLPCKL